MGGSCSTNGEEERCNMALVGKPEGKRLLGRTYEKLLFSKRLSHICPIAYQTVRGAVKLCGSKICFIIVRNVVHFDIY